MALVANKLWPDSDYKVIANISYLMLIALLCESNWISKILFCKLWWILKWTEDNLVKQNGGVNARCI